MFPEWCRAIGGVRELTGINTGPKISASQRKTQVPDASIHNNEW